MRTNRPGRHELGQNFLIDRTTIDTFVSLVADTHGPVIEIGAGDGALTLPLQRLGRSLTGIELDERSAARLARRVHPPTEIVQGDFLDFPLPGTPHVLVGNLPFHQTTSMLRRVLHATDWTESVLLVQWEVARRRAGVGGATMMTAQWWPWFAFRLACRVPAAAFRPRPGVDGGLMTMVRRQRPLVPAEHRRRYQEFVQKVFTGKGRCLVEVVMNAAPGLSQRRIRQWMKQHRIASTALPKHLAAEQWAGLFRLQQTRRPPGRRTVGRQ